MSTGTHRALLAHLKQRGRIYAGINPRAAEKTRSYRRLISETLM